MYYEHFKDDTGIQLYLFPNVKNKPSKSEFQKSLDIFWKDLEVRMFQMQAFCGDNGTETFSQVETSVNYDDAASLITDMIYENLSLFDMNECTIYFVLRYGKTDDQLIPQRSLQPVRVLYAKLYEKKKVGTKHTAGIVYQWDGFLSSVFYKFIREKYVPKRKMSTFELKELSKNMS